VERFQDALHDTAFAEGRIGHEPFHPDPAIMAEDPIAVAIPAADTGEFQLAAAIPAAGIGDR